MAEKRFLLCRPLGGLNDTLCQINHCRRYAEKYGRILIVDGRYSGILGEFGDYFEMAGTDHIISTTSPEMPDIDAMDCLPAEVRGRVSTIKWSGYTSPEGYVTIDSITGVPLRFDWTCNHEVPLLIHQQSGGGISSFDLLEHLTLVPALAARVRAAIEAVPQPYLALHIRNTDYKTDLNMVMEFMLKRNVRRNLVLCTDNPATYDWFRAGLPKVRMHRITTPAVEVTGPLHRTARNAEAKVRRDVAENSIIELCALAGANTLFVCALDSHDTPKGLNKFQTDQTRLSGFSRLAVHLCRDKARLRRFMGAAGEGFLPDQTLGRFIYIRPGVAPTEV